MRGLVVAVLAAALFSSPAFATDIVVTPRLLIFTENYAIAIALEQRCPTWRMDRAKAAIALTMSGLPDDAYERPGPLHDRFMEAGAKVDRMDVDTACDAAEMLFGPDGTVSAGFMKKR